MTHGSEELWDCAIRSAARILFLRHSNLTTGKGGPRAWPCLASPLGFTSDSMLLPGDQLTHVPSCLFSETRQRKTKENKDEIQEARCLF